MERRAKQEEHKVRMAPARESCSEVLLQAETERILQAQQAEIERKRLIMEEKEAQRTAAMEAERIEVSFLPWSYIAAS